MARVKRGIKARRRRNRVLKEAQGFRGRRGTAFTLAKETLDRALVFAYRDRKQRKREFRKLWITRINAAVRPHGLSYSRFINGLKQANITLNRKVLSELAIRDEATFSKIAQLSSQSQTSKSAA